MATKYISEAYDEYMSATEMMKNQIGAAWATLFANIQPIIDALKPKEKNKPPTLFNLKINTVVLRNTQLKYDIISAEKNNSKLDPNHLHIYDFNADLQLPCIKNDDFLIDIKRFALKGKCRIHLQGREQSKL
mgnify:CR=1 FL=1